MIEMKPRGGIHQDSITVALRMMVILPTAPGLAREQVMDELEISEARFYRILRAMENAEIVVESAFSSEGKKLYYLPRQRQSLINRLMGQ